MNYCANHPDSVVTAYCQNCGKGLCSACVRTVQGNTYCEPCMTARAAGGPGAPNPAGTPGGWTPGAVPPPPGPNVGTATMLGFIPGVGAMYNGQYIKAIVHVLVFVILVGMADRFWFFGLLIGFWVLYQVFDAHQTAKARIYGLPLPDPFGLNELGNRLGGHPVPPPQPPPGSASAAGTPPPPGAPGAPGPVSANPYADWAEQVRQQAHQVGEQAGQWGEYIRARVVSEASQATQAFQQRGPGGMGGPGSWGAPPAAGFTPSASTPPGGWASTPPPQGWVGPVPPVPPAPPIPPQMELERARREPIGAIVLILLGMLFLLNTMGFFSFGWIGHGWPWIIVLIAVWLLVRNAQGRFGFHARVGPMPPQPPQPQETKQPGDEK
jgi:hypothetical protein